MRSLLMMTFGFAGSVVMSTVKYISRNQPPSGFLECVRMLNMRVESALAKKLWPLTWHCWHAVFVVSVVFCAHAVATPAVSKSVCVMQPDHFSRSASRG